MLLKIVGHHGRRLARVGKESASTTRCPGGVDHEHRCGEFRQGPHEHVEPQGSRWQKASVDAKGSERRPPGIFSASLTHTRGRSGTGPSLRHESSARHRFFVSYSHDQGEFPRSAPHDGVPVGWFMRQVRGSQSTEPRNPKPNLEWRSLPSPLSMCKTLSTAPRTLSPPNPGKVARMRHRYL